jgi:deazaflavin-dependent oxidoreductase (nitroreductase family)
MSLQTRLARGAAAINNAVFRATRGRVMGSIKRVPVLLLTTTGARSGQTRTTPVMDIEVDGVHHVIASAGGSAKHPAWFYNVRAHPAVRVETRSGAFDATAAILEGDERDRVYEIATSRMSNFGRYAEQTDRTIPVVRLDRTA